jgi:small subunit ribosomal protein S19
MSRSSWKHKIVNLEKFKVLTKNIKIDYRNENVSKEFLNTKVSIYNGKRYIPVYIDQDKIGYKFGEFSFTRKRCIHKEKKKLKKK